MPPTAKRGSSPRARVVGLVIAALVLAPLLGGAATGAAQGADFGWVAVQVYACPSGMTAATLDPWGCALVTDGIETQLWAENNTPLLGLGEASFDGWTWTWQGLAVGTAEAPIPYQIVQTAPPAGAVDAVVQYAPAAGEAATVWLSTDVFGADLHIYNFYP